MRRSHTPLIDVNHIYNATMAATQQLSKQQNVSDYLDTELQLMAPAE